MHILKGCLGDWREEGHARVEDGKFIKGKQIGGNKNSCQQQSVLPADVMDIRKLFSVSSGLFELTGFPLCFVPLE